MILLRLPPYLSAGLASVVSAAPGACSLSVPPSVVCCWSSLSVCIEENVDGT